MELSVVERILDQVSEQTEVILSAHAELGIPLEELICAAVRRAATRKVVDARQEELKLMIQPSGKEQ